MSVAVPGDECAKSIHGNFSKTQAHVAQVAIRNSFRTAMNILFEALPRLHLAGGEPCQRHRILLVSGVRN